MFGTPIVLDIGSGNVKMGFAGEESPSVMIPNIVGRPRKQQQMFITGSKSQFIGEEANAKRSLLSINYPVQRSVVKSWTDLEAVLHYGFYHELGISVDDHPILINEVPRNSPSQRYKMAQLLFEQFDVPAIYMESAATTTLFASGRTTGIVLDVGAGSTHAVPIAEGYTFPHAIHTLSLAGKDITDYLIHMISELGHRFGTSAEWILANEIKEKSCYIVEDYEEALESKNIKEEKYTLPDGQELKLDSHLFRATEVLFQPDIIGKEFDGLHETLFDSISRCNIDIKPKLYENIVLSGGVTFTKGFKNRLLKEMEELVPNTMEVNVIEPENRLHSAWVGGSIFACLSSFRNQWLTKDEYEESGVYHKKEWEKHLFN